MKLIRNAAELKARAKFSPQVLQLADLLYISPELAADQSLATRLAIMNTIFRALEVERLHGETALHLYDMNRHLNLYAAFRAELALLKQRTSQMSIAELEFANSVISQAA